jgi:hypothetical protein
MTSAQRHAHYLRYREGYLRWGRERKARIRAQFPPKPRPPKMTPHEEYLRDRARRESDPVLMARQAEHVRKYKARKRAEKRLACREN